MRRVLFISPHFPPDSSAGTHRARLLAPRLAAVGWDPVVLTVHPDTYGTRLDPDLAASIPADLRVERVRAIQPRAARMLGVGDLGLRALPALRRAALRLVAGEKFDAVFITIYPTYPAVIGPTLRHRAGIPFILDYQDPWVGSWGKDVGTGIGGRPDVRSRVTRRIGQWLEPRTLAHASGVTAVSHGTFDAICTRVPHAAALPFLELPIGFDPDDAFRAEATQAHFDPADGMIHLCYAGALLPHGLRALHACLDAIAQLRSAEPRVGDLLRVHFFGTSNQAESDVMRVLPAAQRAGIADIVSEHPGRLDYFEALAVQRDAHIVLLLGSTEPHYTPSKIYPALLAGSSFLALYHPASSAGTVLRAAGAERPLEFIALDPAVSDAALSTATMQALHRLTIGAAPGMTTRSTERAVPAALRPYSAQSLSADLGRFMDRIVDGAA